MVQAISGDDILLWPDGYWCLRCEYDECTSDRSDDFEVIPFGTARHSVVSES